MTDKVCPYNGFKECKEKNCPAFIIENVTGRDPSGKFCLFVINKISPISPQNRME
jgi:hypothetical protein